MGYNFIECERDQMYLLPVSMRDWLSEDHLAWFILDAVQEMDLSRFYRRYRSDGWGRAAYEPGMMVSLLLYAYCVGIRSSRRIEKSCEVDVAFRVITANQQPDYSTVCRFRKEFEKELGDLFTEVLRLCVAAGLVKVGLLALDGTKIKGNASLAANRSYEYLHKKVERMLGEAEAVDAEEDALYGRDRRGDELPSELAHQESRLAALRRAKQEIERQAQEKADEERAKIEVRREEERISGKKKRGRKPKEPQESPNPKAKANLTDPHSRIMKTPHGYIQGYNAQAMVTKEQIIVSAEVTQQHNDVKQLHPMINKASEELAAAGVKRKIGVVVADAGYYSEENIRQLGSDRPELLLATTRDHKQRQAMKDAECPRGRIPNAATVKERMERKLLTKRGKALYRKRSQTVEPVLGQIKEGRSCRRLMRRGVSAAGSEWRLICAAHDLLKLWRSGKMPAGSGRSQVCRA